MISIKNTSRVEARFKCSIIVTRASPCHEEAQPVFSTGKLTGSYLYPKTGLSNGLSRTSSVESSITMSTQGQYALINNYSCFTLLLLHFIALF